MNPNEIKELKLEMLRLKSLCLRAAQEIKDLDCTIMHAADSVEGLKEWLGLREDDEHSGVSSISLINHLEGRTRDGYVENFKELSELRKEIESVESLIRLSNCVQDSDSFHLADERDDEEQEGGKGDGEETCMKPWGWYKVLEDGERCKVKLIQVNPGCRLSLQSHSKRQEHWYVVRGELTVEQGANAEELTRRNYAEKQSVEIGFGELHRASNESEEPVQFVEVQTGIYFGEDDIVRYEDDYGRN